MEVRTYQLVTVYKVGIASCKLQADSVLSIAIHVPPHRFERNTTAQTVFTEQMRKLLRNGTLSKEEMTKYVNSRGSYKGKRGFADQLKARVQLLAQLRAKVEYRSSGGGGGGGGSGSGGSGVGTAAAAAPASSSSSTCINICSSTLIFSPTVWSTRTRVKLALFSVSRNRTNAF